MDNNLKEILMHVYFVYNRPKTERLYDYKRIIPFDITMKLAIAILKIDVIFSRCYDISSAKEFRDGLYNKRIDRPHVIYFFFFLSFLSLGMIRIIYHKDNLFIY